MRKTSITRKTKETNIFCEVNLDGTGLYNISTGIGFFDHMLEIFSHHSLIDLNLKAEGDIQVDLHHTVEDCGYSIAQAINKSLSDKKGIKGGWHSIQTGQGGASVVARRRRRQQSIYERRFDGCIFDAGASRSL